MNEFVFGLDEATDKGQKYMRVKMVDNFAKLEQGETVFKSTGFNAYDMDFSFLKNAPKNTEILNG